MKKNSIVLSKEQRHALEQLVSKGAAPARKIKHAEILLKIDESDHGHSYREAKTNIS